MEAMAIRQYEAGEEIFRCMPFCHAISSERRHFYCDYCFKKIQTMYACHVCELMFYCSQDCQTADWSHVLECPIFKNVGQERLPKEAEPRFLLRLYLLTKVPEIANKMHTLYNGSIRCFWDLQTHENEIRMDATRTETFSELFSILKDIVGYQIDGNHLCKVFCVSEINRHSIMSEIYEDLGMALYLEMSIFDHSCDPDAREKFHGSQLELRAEKRIPEGKVIKVSYTRDVEKTKLERNQFLQSNYYFTCHCVVCDSPDDQPEQHRQELKELDQKMKQQILVENYGMAYEIGMTIIPILNRVYGLYHPKKTAHLIQLFQMGGMCRFFERDDFHELMTILQDCARVTMVQEEVLWKKVAEQIELVRNPETRNEAANSFKPSNWRLFD